MKTSKTKPLGKGTRNVGVNMTEAMRDKLRSLADQAGMSLSSYMKKIIEDWIASGKTLETRVVTRDSERSL